EFVNLYSVNDKNTAYLSSEMFTSEERSQFGEIDFGGRDEPLVSQPYTDRLNVPTQQSSINSVPLPSQPYMSVNPYMNPPAFNEALPQIIGYDPNGMPIYSQSPVTYSPPQIIGYDPNGMPIYAQSPVTYAPPQIIGYDPSGMPIYAQQPVLYQQSSVPQFQSVSEQLQKNTSGNNEKFLDFIDDGKNKKNCRKSEEDFFGKSSGMGDVSAKGLDVGSLKKQDSKKKNYMNETPLVDGDKLIPNDSAKFSKMYMRQTEKVSAENLEEKKTYGANHIMRATKEVDVNRLNVNKKYKSRITMSGAGEADPDTLESYTPKAKKPIMAEADHAVEAMPKKKPEYVDELDKIELPDYMKAKKTVRNDTPSLPELPEL
ncbi:MAG: hypothetical protein K2F73_05655, partial [Ruminococcus sp.]|nr:hypothetical protein [Ruminococcus sp.]